MPATNNNGNERPRMPSIKQSEEQTQDMLRQIKQDAKDNPKSSAAPPPPPNKPRKKVYYDMPPPRFEINPGELWDTIKRILGFLVLCLVGWLVYNWFAAAFTRPNEPSAVWLVLIALLYFGPTLLVIFGIIFAFRFFVRTATRISLDERDRHERRNKRR